MITYFADRQLNIIGSASTDLPSGLRVVEDKKTDDLESGTCTFEGKIPWTDETRAHCEECVKSAHYVLRESEHEHEFYTISEDKSGTKGQQVEFYAEDAGLSLICDVAPAYPPDSDNYTIGATGATGGTGGSIAMTLTEYAEMLLYDTGFEIGINEAESDYTELEYGWEEGTVTERLRDVAKEFGYEIAYSFKIAESGFKIEHLYVDIYKKRGADEHRTLYLNKDIDSIERTRNVNKLATSLLVVGQNGLTLEGYEYESEDNDFVVADQYFYDRRQVHACLQSPSALAKYGRIVNGEAHHITRPFTADGIGDQARLAEAAAEELEKCCEPEVNYECDITEIKSGFHVGDTIYIVDEKGELYLKSRLLKVETSVSDGTQVITLGEFLIQDGGISEEIYHLVAKAQAAKEAAEKVQQMAEDGEFDGATGATGADGFSPVVELTETDDGVQIKITDKTGEHTAEVENGPTGATGATGAAAPTITSIITWYSLANAAAIPSGQTYDNIKYTDWSMNIPPYVVGKYYWKKDVTTYSDGHTSESSPILALDVQLSAEAEAAASAARAASDEATAISEAALQYSGTPRRVFNSQPTPPYSKNDIWYDGVHGKTLLCNTAKDYTYTEFTGSAFVTGTTYFELADNGCYFETKDTTKQAGKTYYTRTAGSYAASDWAEYSKDVSNYFWYDANGTYIAQVQGDVTSGYAQLFTSSGIVQQYNGHPVTSWTNSGMVFYDYTDGASHTLAAYTKNGVVLYGNNSPVASFLANGISFDSETPFMIGNSSSYVKWVKENNVWKIKIVADTIQMGGKDIGSGWYTGTAMTYTDNTAHVYSGSGITNAIVGDMYLNTSTDNIYRCTLGGNANTAKWLYVSNITGDTGNGISSISLIGSSGNTKTYRITYTNGGHFDFTVTDGEDVTSQYVTYRANDVSGYTGSAGLFVHSSSETNPLKTGAYGTLVRSDGEYIIQNGVKVAQFGSAAIIGPTTGGYVSIQNNSIVMNTKKFSDAFNVTATGYEDHTTAQASFTSDDENFYITFNCSYTPKYVIKLELTTTQGQGEDPYLYRKFYEASTITISGNTISIVTNKAKYANATLLYATCTYSTTNPIYITAGIKAYNASDFLFTIGNGYGNYTKNALEVDYNGNTKIGGVLNVNVHREVLSVGSSFKLYNSSNKITLRSTGNICELRGAVSPKNSITGSSDEYTICTVPAGYRPSTTIVLLMQGSVRGFWLFRVNTNGTVTFSRYRTTNSTGYIDADNETWLPFHATWLID